MIKFGTDGWRAVIGDTFTFENVRKVALAHAQVLKSRGKEKVIIGYDYRFMSEHFAYEVYRVFKGLGFEVSLINGPATTPMVSYAVKYMGFQNGVMITASHNPPEYNGYKIKDSFGGSATPEFIREVEKAIEKVEIPTDIPKAERFYTDVEGNYLEKVRELVNLELIRERKLKVVHDAMYGTSAGLLSKALEGTATEVYSIRSYRDPLFGGHAPEPVEKNLKPLIEKVRATEANVGIANDGDGDRIALVDEKGNFVNAQLIYVLLLLHLIKHKGIREGIVVKTVSTTYLADRICQAEGIELREVAVGFKNINELILKEKVVFGGEESGGYGIVHFLPERDGLLAGMYVLDLLASTGKDLSQIIEDIFKTYGSAHFKRVDFHAEEEKKERIKKLVENPPDRVGSFVVSRINTVDGIKFVFPNDGWVLMRPSGTEPLVRVYAEMPTHEELERVLQESLKLLD